LSKDSGEPQLTETILNIVKEKKPDTVKQLTSLVKEKLAIDERKIIDRVLKLQSEGKIKLSKQSVTVPPEFSVYLVTGQALWYWITVATAAVTVLTVFAIPEDFYPWVYIRYVLGTIFVLWLPGYTFIKALFPTHLPILTSREDLDTIERIALSVGMSLALVPIVGLLLNYTPWGIRLTPIVLSLLALTLVLATVALVREKQAKNATT
jgi:hypothetical protein